jgi:hypothetical protein
MTTVTNMLGYPTTLSTNLNPGVVGNMYVCTATLTLTLPSPATAGQYIGAKVRSATGIVTINRNSSDVIYGAGVAGTTSITLGADGASVVLMSDGTNWHIVDGAQDTGWLPIPTYTNSWASNSGPATGGTVAGYRLTGNTVRCSGTIKTGTSATAAFTLPAGARPTTTLYVIGANAGALTVPVGYSITNVGVVTPNFSSGTAPSIEFTFTVD